jgi:hypothetical protein
VPKKVKSSVSLQMIDRCISARPCYNCSYGKIFLRVGAMLFRLWQSSTSNRSVPPTRHGNHCLRSIPFRNVFRPQPCFIFQENCKCILAYQLAPENPQLFGPDIAHIASPDASAESSTEVYGLGWGRLSYLGHDVSESCCPHLMRGDIMPP